MVDIHPFDYAGIRVWGVRNGGDSWRELQKRAAEEGAPLDALFLNAQEQWITASDLPQEHSIHGALEQDRERCRRGLSVSSDGLMSKRRLRERARGPSGAGRL